MIINDDHDDSDDAEVWCWNTVARMIILMIMMSVCQCCDKVRGGDGGLFTYGGRVV